MEEERIISSEVEDVLEEEEEELSFLRRNVNIRHILAIMGFFGFTVLNTLRVSMSIAIVSMVDWKSVQNNDTSNKSCTYSANEATRSSEENGPFEWQPDIQGHILACYFYGLIVTQYFGGLFAERVSAKYMLLVGTVMSSLGTVLIPVIATTRGYSVMILQIVKGLGQGFIIPSFSVLVGKWIPKSERFVSMCLIGSGIPLGGFFGMAVAGVISSSSELGWTYVFYIYGGIGFIWCFFWIILIYDSPLTHPYITQNEVVRILKSQTILPVKTKTPYKHIFKSMAVWSYIIVGFASYWALAIYTLVIPLFMGTILKFGIEMNGLMSSIPHLFEMFIFILGSVLNDKLKRKNKNLTVVHKVSISIGLLAFSLCMLGVTFTACDRLLTVIVLVLGLGLCGFCFASTSVVPLTMSPRYAGFISAVMNTFGAISGIIVPNLIGYLTVTKRTMEEWSILFYLSFAISLFAALLFIIFGSCEVQEWNDPTITIGDEPRRPSHIMQVERTPQGNIEISMAQPKKIDDLDRTLVVQAPTT